MRSLNTDREIQYRLDAAMNIGQQKKNEKKKESAAAHCLIFGELAQKRSHSNQSPNVL